MGRKVHPIGMRLGIHETWQGRWFAEGTDYQEQLLQDFAIRTLFFGPTSKGGTANDLPALRYRQELPDAVRDGKAGVARVEVERFPGKVHVILHTAKPGVLIGRKGEGIKKIRQALESLVGKKVDLEIREVQKPDLEAILVAQNIADQLERRIAYRRAMKRAIQQAMREGAQGIKIEVAGRLAGAEMARRVWLREGRVPLQTLRSKIDYARAEAKTTYGQIGVKVWIYKGEVLPEVEEEKAESTDGVYVTE